MRPALRSATTMIPTPGVVLVLVLLLLALLLPAGPSVANPLGRGAGVDPHVPGWSPDLGIAVGYRLPADGEVLRAFDPPATAFGAGHRGVDLAVAVGGEVRAAGMGVVTFAGPVAGRRWISIAHADGHLTTYGPLAGLRVARGDAVHAGASLASLATGGHGAGGRDAGLHWGARDHTGAYIDPLSLVGVDRRRPSLVGTGTWQGTDHQFRAYEPWSGGQFAGAFVAASPEARDPGYVVPPNPNHVVLLPGLASDSSSGVFDASHLGYDPSSVTAFSYAGHAAGQGPADDPRRDHLPYGPADTWTGPGPAAALLAEQLRIQAEREPGRAVDLIGHSMGGSVILHYLLEHHDPYDPTLPPIGHVITIGSPLRGSDLAVVGEVLGDDLLLGPVAAAIQGGAGGTGQRLPLDAPAIGELAAGSAQVEALAQAWDAALLAGVGGPLAMGTRILTIAGSRDVVVTPHRTRHPATPGTEHGLGGTVMGADGAIVDHRVLPGGHSSVLDTEAVLEVVWQFLAGEEVVASPGHAGTIVGGELSNLGATAARVLHLWGLWRAPGIRPGGTPLP